MADTVACLSWLSRHLLTASHCVNSALLVLCFAEQSRQSIEPFDDVFGSSYQALTSISELMPRSRSPSRSPRRGERPRRDTTPMRREAPSRCSLLVRGLSKACRSSAAQLDSLARHSSFAFSDNRVATTGARICVMSLRDTVLAETSIVLGTTTLGMQDAVASES